MGNVTLDPRGGQVPWHNQEQEEVYFVVEGAGEMCLGDERRTVTSGQMVYIPPGVFHQLTNVGETPLRMIDCYGHAGDVAHWRQELGGRSPQGGHRSGSPCRRVPGRSAQTQDKPARPISANLRFSLSHFTRTFSA